MSFDPDFDGNFSANSKEARNYVKFYRQWMRNNFKSKEQGVEVGDYADFIIIISPGQPKSEVRRKANDADKSQYRQEWQAYSEGKEHQVSGTPIEVLPGLAAGMADALKALYIYTIEQMANLPDVALQKVGMGGSEIRQRAKAYLEKSSGEVIALKAQLEEATKTIAALNAVINSQNQQNSVENAPKKRGRPKLTAVA